MFYCDSCAKDNEWPETGFKSTGTCEVCEQPDKLCNERASGLLPIPKWAREKYGEEATS